MVPKFKRYFRQFRVALVLFTIAALFFGSCKSAKSLTASGKPNEQLSAKQLIKTHEKNFTKFETLQAKVRIDITQDEKTQGSTFSLRIEKDKVIWLSAALGLARLKITPEKVQFYSKIENQYFDGDYALLSDFAGTELDFFKVQNILLGHAIFNLKSEPHKLRVNELSYILQPEEQAVLFDLIYLINPSHFKLDSLQLYQQLEGRMLQVDYSSYQKFEGQVLPKEIRIIAVDGPDQATIDIEIKSVNLNNELRFPFKIPEGFDEIVIK
jgi:outer membrane biogenesis lipoprotein LolB